MSKEEVKLPNPHPIKELRNRLKKLKEDRIKHYDVLIKAWKKKPAQKIAKSNRSDAEI